jgi:hypothetical protein
LYHYKVTADGIPVPSKVAEETKTLSEGFVGGVAMLTLGADFAADQGVSSAISSARGGTGQVLRGRFAAWEGSNRFYVGAAWEHEFDGEANARIGGMKIEDAPNLKGNTGIAEFGWVLSPSSNKNLTIDLGIQAYGGKHKGATGSAQLKYVF